MTALAGGGIPTRVCLRFTCLAARVLQCASRTCFLAGAALDALIDVGHGRLLVDYLKTLGGATVLTFTVTIAKVMIDIDLATNVLAFPALDYHSLTSGETRKADLLYMAFHSTNV